MTGIAERAERLRDLVVQTIQRERLMNEASTLSVRAEQLEGWGQDLRAMLPAVRALREARKPSKALGDVVALKRSAERALQDYRNDPQSIRTPDMTAINVFWRQAPKQLAGVEAALLGEWRAYVNAAMPEYQPAVVRVLAGDQATTIESQLVQFSKLATALASNLPARPEEAAQAQALGQEAKSVMQRFDLQAMPPEVRAFIQAALRDGATLDLLTPNVLAWLRERGIEHDVRLSFVASR